MARAMELFFLFSFFTILSWIQCDTTNKEQQKTHCQQIRESPGGLLGAFVPECDANGQYVAKQCHRSTGHCWCVDNQGEEIKGTRKGPGQGQVQCNSPECQKSLCQHILRVLSGRGLLGAFVPKCDANGDFLAKQCHGSTGYCWCVDRCLGKRIIGTKKRSGQGEVNCNRPDVSHFEHQQPGSYVPQYDANGQYTAKQCHGSTGECWCVDNTGEEISGTRKGPGQGEVNC